MIQDIYPHVYNNAFEPGVKPSNDDIIFSFVREYQKKTDLTLEVVSSDKDLKQLLQANVVITDAAKNQTTTLLTFQQEWGFSPEHIVDYLALIGDSADNIKGVAGI